MKKLILSAVVVMMMASASFAASGAMPAPEKIAAAKADWDNRFVPLFTGSEPTGHDANVPGVMVSWQRADGVIEQHGSSLTPREHWLNLHSGGGE